MRFARALVLVVPLWFVLTAESNATPSPSASPAATPSPSPSPTPPPTPTPVNAFISLDVSAGDPSTVITVTGGQFLPNEQTSLYWDTAEHVAGSATADVNGSFSNVKVKPFAGDAPGVHHLCASVPPNPCANFTLQAPAASPSPSPTPSESPSPSPSPTVTATATPSSTPVAATLNGFDVISRPPFVFLPIAGALAIGLALAFWLYSILRRPRQVALTSAAVVHRAVRPDYSAGFGAPPAPPEPQPETSAWDESPVRQAPPYATPAQPAPREAGPPAEESQISGVEWGPPVEWGTGSSGWGFPEPPLTESEDAPEPRD